MPLNAARTISMVLSAVDVYETAETQITRASAVPEASNVSSSLLPLAATRCSLCSLNPGPNSDRARQALSRVRQSTNVNACLSECTRMTTSSSAHLSSATRVVAADEAEGAEPVSVRGRERASDPCVTFTKP